MKIKNIKQYRSFYKSTRPVSSDLEEHFIGNHYFDLETDKKKFGWFTMYHGDRDGFGNPQNGIENFLQSFLDMAKDGQAVYEFLQNAVDAGSTHYTMIWGEDSVDGSHYLLVANNGEMFSPNSIRSILNVGSSTKNADSKTIGKFGIGFKLAHRLVGKDNGLQELINENSGPILFSWKNYDLNFLADGSSPVPENMIMSANEKDEIIVDDENPWLFKILITSFPCLPENQLIPELPIMADGKQSSANPFTNHEYQTLARWVQKNQNILNEEIYNTGSLFFIKLGSGKESELAEVNLSEGVKFALAILRETADSKAKKNKILHTVQLNDNEPITYPDLEYIKFGVDRKSEEDTYAYIRFGVEKSEELTSEQKRKIFEEADIEVLFGFRKHNDIGNYFKGAPNLYLYFPLSEEVHNFNYILHCNAFYKGSSRTFLHKGSGNDDGINERLLKIIVEKIDHKLKTLSDSDLTEDRQLFLDFYAALLTSGRSTTHDRLWIEEPYSKPIDSLLGKYIPVKNSGSSHGYSITDNAAEVYIKKTAVEIDSDTWSIQNIHWFYWADAEPEITANARLKLNINNYSINNLLTQSDSIYEDLNKWIDRDNNKIKIILSEISTLESDALKNAVLSKNFFNIEFLRFDNDELLSINDFIDKENQGYFLVHNKLSEITDLLKKLELVFTIENFDHFNFPHKFFNFFPLGSQVRSHTQLTKLFSTSVKAEKLQQLSAAEKKRIFEAFRGLNDTPGERLGELRLLNNNFNNPVPFKNLYTSSQTVWLDKFCINSSEDAGYYKNYLLNNLREVYQNVIYKFWDQLIEYININRSQASVILDDLIVKYNESNSVEKNNQQLSNFKLTVYKSEVISYDNLYFNKSLTDIGRDEFARIQNTAASFFEIHIPDQFLIPYLYLEPFKTAPVLIESKIETRNCSLAEITDLLEFYLICGLDFFHFHTISQLDNTYVINSGEQKKQINSDNEMIISYLNYYYPSQYEPIPASLAACRNEIKLSGKALIHHLIDLFSEEDPSQELDLIEIVLAESFDLKKLLIDKIHFIYLDGSWENIRLNHLYIKLLGELLEFNLPADQLSLIHKKINITKEEQEINIGDIDSAHDAVSVIKDGREILLSQSQILDLENAGSIQFIHQFYEEAVKREFINKSSADILFKISNSGITDELVSKFNRCLVSKKIVNIHQLAFLWFSGRFKAEEYKNYSILSHDDQWYAMEKQLIFYSEENILHIDPKYVLNSCYAGLRELLSMNDLEVFNYNDNETDIAAARFLFVKGCSANILSGGEETNSKLDYLYKGWLSLSLSLKDYKRNEEWHDYLGINPAEFILDGIHLKEEILPEVFLKWTSSDPRRADLLKALGVYTGSSPIEKMRSFLLGTIQEKPTEINLQRFNDSLLLNTAKGLSGLFNVLKNEPVIFSSLDTSRIELAQNIIESITYEQLDEIPVLIHTGYESFKFILNSTATASLYSLEEELHLKLKSYENNNLMAVYEYFNVIKIYQALSEETAVSCKEVPFIKNYVVSDSVSEHSEPFYHTWKSENKISLYKEEKLNFDYFIQTDADLIFIASISKGSFHIENSQDCIKIFYRDNISLEELSSALSGGYSELSAAVSELIKKRNTMLASFYNALNAAGRDEVKSAHLQALEYAFEQENLKLQRQNLLNSILENTRYSYLWFESYLNFLLTFENRQDIAAQKTISFQEIKRYAIKEEISSTYFLLCGASSLIPANIEDFDDFRILLIIKNQQNENIKVEGVSKRGQDLLIYCRETIPQSIINKFGSVVQIKISFIPVIDLLERLHKAFTNKENITPWDDIKTMLPDLHFIYGPPGTGKTTELCRMIKKELGNNRDAKYLVLTPTNKAADVLCKKLLNSDSLYFDDAEKFKQNNACEQMLTVTRLGKPTDPELENIDSAIYQNSVDVQQLQYTNVLASSIHRIPYFEVSDKENPISKKLFKLNNHWDFVVFDEASMTNLPYLVFAAVAIKKYSPNAKFIIAGDPKQIPPVVDVNDKDLENLDLQDENIYTMMNIKSFKKDEQILRKNDSITNLATQYRSVKKIGQIFSSLSYGNLLKHYREENNIGASELPEEFRNIFKNNVNFVDIPLSADDSIYKINKLFYSPFHIYSAVLTAEIIKYFDAVAQQDKTWTIGLIAPYKAQAVLLNKLITSFGISDKLKIYSDTVHGFQGDECDIIFFISNPNSYHYSGHPKSLLSKEYIYNVAVSRAKDYLIVLHPFDSIKNNTFINSILDSYAENFETPEIIKSSDIEKKLFKQKNYIKENSYITGHDNINVFGQIEMKYFIKTSESAVDIQLRKH